MSGLLSVYRSAATMLGSQQICQQFIDHVTFTATVTRYAAIRFLAMRSCNLLQ